MQPAPQEDLPASSIPARHRRSLREGLPLFLILLLLIGGVVLLVVRQFNQAARNLAQPAQDLPTIIHWQPILQHYMIQSLVAAPSDPALLYVCAMPSLPEFDPNSLPSPSASSQNQPPSEVLLRSADSGTHWQSLKITLGSGFSCSIVVNPANARDLYVTRINFASAWSSKQVFFLKHSSDGGQTWTTIQATLTTPGGQHVPWNGAGLRFVGDRLFAVQQLSNVSHLISSTDGGRTWGVLDKNLSKPHQDLRSYAVDPTMPTTIYALVGPLVVGWFSYAPLDETPTPLPSPIPANQRIDRLYKTTDGGATWQELLSSVPYDSSLQLALSNHNLIYIGGLTGSFNSTHRGIFHMQFSTDGGVNWQRVLPPVNVPLLNNWLIDSSGLLYDTVYNIPGTHASLTPVPLTSSIRRYDPSTNQWSSLNIPPTAGFLIAITHASAKDGAIFWASNLDTALYRGVL